MQNGAESRSIIIFGNLASCYEMTTVRNEITLKAPPGVWIFNTVWPARPALVSTDTRQSLSSSETLESSFSKRGDDEAVQSQTRRALTRRNSAIDWPFPRPSSWCRRCCNEPDIVVRRTSRARGVPAGWQTRESSCRSELVGSDWRRRDDWHSSNLQANRTLSMELHQSHLTFSVSRPLSRM